MVERDSRRFFSKDQRSILYDRAEGRCQGCSTALTDGWHADHKIPWAAGGPTYGFDPRPVQWEVEALEPAELQRLVLAAIAPYVDRDVLARQVAREEGQRRALTDFLDGWDAAGGEAPS
ncbi:HNH endonuclease [Streptomyces sp. NPDC029674]|uniref:HNH endonuclease n=1 Tax=Streptomyces sp. NPDC029674 TaxID=3365297 RepID=UPI003850D79A